MRGLICVCMLCVAQLVAAQIRIIPREKILETANPKIVASSLRLTPATVNFGTIDEMSGVWQGSAKVQNTGKDTIVVTRLKSTCGCLQVALSGRVLAPGAEATLSLKYYPRGHAGRVLQRVFLYTERSDEDPSALLVLEGLVTASADRSDDYPYSRGTLRLRQQQLRFVAGEPSQQRIACMNGGSSALRPKADTLLSSKALRVRFEPEILAPKQEGDMVVEYLGGEGDKGDAEMLKIYINGLNVRPSLSIVTVLIDKK